MLIGKTQSSGSGPIEGIKNLANNLADSFRHFKIEFFGSAEDKNNLLSLDHVHRNIIAIHVDCRNLNTLVRKELENPNQVNKENLLQRINAQRTSIATQRTYLKAMKDSQTTAFKTSNEFIQRKKKRRKRYA